MVENIAPCPFNISNNNKKHGFKGNYLIAKNKSETL
jgi:hypothetical protein